MSYVCSLEHITNAALKVKTSAYIALCKVGRELPKGSDTIEAIVIPPLSLPLHDDISPLLRNKGCTPEVVRALSDAFNRSAGQIRDMYHSTHHQTCRKLIQNPISDHNRLTIQLQHLVLFFESQFRDRIHAAEQLAIDRAERMQQLQRATNKVVFNQEFVPLLETYFEYNAYPSTPDRIALARKSMMTPRQIEVWFQNHRNRAKKEGKVLRRLATDPLPLKLSLDSLEKKMSYFIIPEVERKIRTDTSKLEQSNEEIEKDIASRVSSGEECNVTFSFDSPPHAFPTAYPPSCTYDPFPVKKGNYTFASPAWFRTPALSRPTRPIPDLDELITDFAIKLVLKEDTFKKERLKSTHKVPKVPWFASTYIMPSPAPHPALIRPSSPTMHSSTVCVFPTVSAPPLHHRSLYSLGQFSQPITLLPAMQNRGTTTRRKAAQLPKRSPTNSNLEYRSTNPVTSAASSPSRNPSSSSRASSSSPNNSSTRRLSSCSDSSSSSLSTLNTPVGSPKSTQEYSLPSVFDSEDNNVHEGFRGTHLLHLRAAPTPDLSGAKAF